MTDTLNIPAPSPSDLAALPAGAIRRGDSGYEERRQDLAWNGREFGRHPDLIIAAQSEDDVVAAVALARARGLPISARGSGHSYSGVFLRQGGILLDLSGLQQIEIDAEARQAWVQPGATGGILTRRLAEVGLAFPTGHSDAVALGGFLLGGGLGINCAAWGGMSVFNVAAVDLVTADGRRLRASPSENADLYWAARGGGPGLFFIVTRFLLRCHPLPRVITGNTYLLPFSDLPRIARLLEAVCPTVDRRLQVMLAIAAAPPDLASALTGTDHGRIVALNTIAFAATAEEARALQEPFARHPDLADILHRSEDQPTTIEGIYRQGDTMLVSSRYRTDNILTDDIDAAVAVLMAHLPQAPSAATLPLAIWRGDLSFPDAAYSAKGRYFLSTYAQWNDGQDDDANRRWLQRLYDDLAPIATGAYVNEFDIEARFAEISRCYSPDSWQRLRDLRRRHDPDGIFCDVYRG